MSQSANTASWERLSRSGKGMHHPSHVVPAESLALSAMEAAAANHASVTVLTNIAGAVAVTVDRDNSASTTRRFSSKLLPENPFNTFRDYQQTRLQPTISQENQLASSTDEVAEKNVHVTSAEAAAVAVEGIKKGVRDELDRWALQTSRRESMVLWKHECSRYASSSRIGYHPNHPSSSHPSSRPSSAATILRPFSAGREGQGSKQHNQQRASSALPRQPTPLGGEGGEESGEGHHVQLSCGERKRSLTRESDRAVQGDHHTRPRSAIPRLGVDTAEGTGSVSAVVSSYPARGSSASAARQEEGTNGGAGASIGRRRGDDGVSRQSSAARRRRVRSASVRSRSPVDRQGGCNAEAQEEDDDLFEDIYEDLDDEDDDELDNRISIMESRFSTVGRERHSSTGYESPVLGEGPVRSGQPRAAAPRSAATQRPPRAPSQEQQQASNRSRTHHGQVASSTRADGSANVEVGGEATPSSNPIQGRLPLRVIRNRPTSAPVDGSTDNRYHQRGGSVGIFDPMAPLRARRQRLQIRSAHAEASRSAVEREQDARGNGWAAGGLQQEQERRVRDVTTAVPSWDREGDGGNRPASSATTEGVAQLRTASVGMDNIDRRNLPHRSSGSTYSTHADTDNSRPSSAAFRTWIKARPSARSVVSAISSARTLGMDDPELVHLQLEMESRRGGMSQATLARMEEHYSAIVSKNSNTPASRRLPQPMGRKGKVGGASRPVSPKKKTGETSKKASSKGASKKSRSKSPGRGRKTKKTRAGGKGRRAGSVGEGATTAEKKKVYTSAWAFMAEHFPSGGRQGVSLLGLEQEEECQHALETLTRAGVSVSSAALHRALVIPTDRPLETCLAGLPTSIEGLRDAPFPTPPPSRLLPTIRDRHPQSLLMSSFRTPRGEGGVRTRGVRTKRGRGGKSTSILGGGTRGKKKEVVQAR